MTDVGEGKLLATLTPIVPHRTVTDAVWAERFVGPVRWLALLVAVGLLLASTAASDAAPVIRFGLAFAALAVPSVTSLFVRPLALGLDGTEVLVFNSQRWRRKPVELTDVVAATSIELDFPGVFSDAWRIGGYRVGIARTKRSTLRSWCAKTVGGNLISG